MQVESLCDGVREKVKLDKDKIKGALAALRDGKAGPGGFDRPVRRLLPRA